MVKLMGFADIMATLVITSLAVGVEVPLVIWIAVAAFSLLKGLLSVLSPE